MKFTNYVIESNIIAMNANNLGVYMDSLKAVVLSGDRYRVENIGDDITFVPLLIPKQIDNNKKSLLVCSGFHGDENSGPWAIIKYLQKQDKINANISFLPLVNPTGFKQFKRLTTFGTDLNLPGIESPDNILSDNFGRLSTLGVDGVLNLHEDPEEKSDGAKVAYVYKTDDMEDYVVKYMLSTLNDYFEILHDKKGRYDEKIVHGVVKGINKYSWEGILQKEGIPTITTEYSSREYFDKRVECGFEIITGFVELMA